MYHKDVRDLVACGAACGVCAAFKAPVGGVMFAMEMSTRCAGCMNLIQAPYICWCQLTSDAQDVCTEAWHSSTVPQLWVQSCR